MSARLTPHRTADDVIEFAVPTPRAAQALAETLRGKGLAEDVVAGLDRVAVMFDPRQVDLVLNWLGDVSLPDLESSSALEMIEIAVRYGGSDGPDLNDVCAALDLTVDAFIALHTSTIHTVEMIGFTPGFSYISGLPEGLSIPRLAHPRPRVQAGSIGVSVGFTGIYALAGPGGWPLVGRTQDPIFDPSRDDPFLLMPGQRVSFRAI